MKRGQSNKNVAQNVTVLKQVNLIKPSNVVISKRSTSMLDKGTKFCLNVEPSRLDIISSIHSIALQITPTEGQDFMDQAVRTVSELAGVFETSCICPLFVASVLSFRNV